MSAAIINARIDAGLQRQSLKTAPRKYLGASLLGDACERRIQYTYLHQPKSDTGEGGFTAQQLRHFAIGHSLEPLIVSWMQAAGFVLSTRNAKGHQHGFTQASGKIAGHVDGILLSGDESFGYPALWECKTMNRQQWRNCVKQGVAVSHPHYFVQIQLYAAYMELTDHPALLTALNKDTAQLHHEWIAFDPETAQRYSDRAAHILKACEAGEWLPRIAHSDDYFVCRSCAFQRHCWREARE